MNITINKPQIKLYPFSDASVQHLKVLQLNYKLIKYQQLNIN